MIPTKGLWILISINGFGGAVGKTLFEDKTQLVLVGPEREPGNPFTSYSPLLAPPADDDPSDFATLLRKLRAVTEEGRLVGPHGEDHPAVFRRFSWFSSQTIVQVLEMLTHSGITIRVKDIPHKGDDDEVAQAVEMLHPWMDQETMIHQNPKIEEARRRAELWETMTATTGNVGKRRPGVGYLVLALIIIIAILAAIF